MVGRATRWCAADSMNLPQGRRQLRLVERCLLQKRRRLAVATQVRHQCRYYCRAQGRQVDGTAVRFDELAPLVGLIEDHLSPIGNTLRATRSEPQN